MSNTRMVALFDHTLGGPPVISPEAARQRCPFLRTSTGELRAFKVTRSIGDVVVKAHSARDAAAWADQLQWEILSERND